MIVVFDQNGNYDLLKSINSLLIKKQSVEYWNISNETNTDVCMYVHFKTLF